MRNIKFGIASIVAFFLFPLFSSASDECLQIYTFVAPTSENIAQRFEVFAASRKNELPLMVMD